MMGNELIDALVALLGRPVRRPELAEAIGGSARTATRRGRDPDLSALKLSELRGIANYFGVPVVRLLIQLGIVTQTEVMEAADEISPRLTEATPLDLAKRLVLLLGQ